MVVHSKLELMHKGAASRWCFGSLGKEYMEAGPYQTASRITSRLTQGWLERQMNCCAQIADLAFY